jgi:hypothetical protein
MNKIYTCFALLLLVACAPALLRPTVEDEQRAQVRYSGMTLVRLNQGHQLYIEKCGGCHNLFTPPQFSEEKWKKVLPDMAKRSSMNAAQYELVEQYILTMREAKKPEKK